MVSIKPEFVKVILAIPAIITDVMVITELRVATIDHVECGVSLFS